MTTGHESPHDDDTGTAPHDNEHDRPQTTHTHDGDHGHGHHDGDGHEHSHPTGIKGFFFGLFVPHSHDAADSVDDALEASEQGVRAVKISLVLLGATAILQLIVVFISGSVALFADTIHNFSDALTAVPLWIAFVLGRRAATRRYTFGYGRAEDLAGLFIIAMIALSAILAGYESIRRLLEPQPLTNLGWVLAAGIVGFLGNEMVAVYRIRVGRRIDSAALVADGVHARTDGFTSLAVVFGVLGVWMGFPLADPIVGLLITVAIAVLLWGTARDIGRRLLDGVEPELVGRAETALAGVSGVVTVDNVRMRWSGHRLSILARVSTQPGATIEVFQKVEHEAEHALRHALPSVGLVQLSPALPEHHPAHE